MAWGAVGGAIAAVIVGFVFLDWVTGGTATKMEKASAEAAVIQAFAPLCVARAQEEPEKLGELKAESEWKRDDFVVGAGWVDNVSEKYRADVARVCAESIVEGMESQ